METPSKHEFDKLTKESDLAFKAYEHIISYYDGSLTQYDRIISLLQKLSESPESLRNQITNQIIREAHFLFISKSLIWRAIETLTKENTCGKFSQIRPLRDKWEKYFKKYIRPRNSFEHFEDQILGKNTRESSPGFGIVIKDEQIYIGNLPPISLSEISKFEFKKFKAELDNSIASIINET